MRTVDIASLYRNSIGFDRFASLLDASAHRSTNQGSSYPPYNVEVTGENNYRITMAVAGFSIEDIHIESEQNRLTVTGKKPEDENEKTYLHKGLANRNFEHKFQLADHIVVKSATLENGLLLVEMERVIPDALKAKTIEIKSQKVLDNQNAAA